MSEFTPEDQGQPVEDGVVESDQSPDTASPEPEVEESAPELRSDDDELEYYKMLFEEGHDTVTGEGEPSRELRVVAWNMGYSVLHDTDTGWKTVKR